MARMCNQCGCTDIDVDSTRGDAVCTGCGSVLEDQIIVSEVQFAENSGGGSSLIGQFVSSEGPKSISIGGSYPLGMQKESRTVTLQNGKRKIQTLAAQMKLNQHCVDMAFNFFKMAVSKRMTRGRKAPHVIAACLYLVCRTERTPHMLLDFSDALQVNVYTLGKTYLALSKELCINLPDVDPCLYIPRFAHALEFEEKTHDVSMTAMRLVQRMKRDWMSTGRRPSGLCGAALLVAARIHDFSRSVMEIIKVVKVCQSTLRKRLTEFEETPSSQLTIEEFQNIDLEEEHDPPSFTEGKKRAKRLPEYTLEVARLQDEIEETLQKQKPRGIWAAYAKMADADSCSVASDVSRVSELQEHDESCDKLKNTTDAPSYRDFTPIEDPGSCVTDSLPCVADSPSCVTDSLPCVTDSLPCVTDSPLHNVNIPTSDTNSDTPSKPKPDRETPFAHLNVNSSANDVPNNRETILTDEIGRELTLGAEESVIGTEVTSLSSDMRIPSLGEVPGVSSLDGVNEVINECIKEGSEDSRDGTEVDIELDLTGIDDAEIDKYFLTEREVLIKTKIWMEENADFLREQKIKEEKKAKEAEEEAKKPPEKRKKKITRKRKGPQQEAATAQEAIQKIIQEKRISCKINYDVLNDLNVKSSVPSVSRVKSEMTLSGPLTDNSLSISRLRKASVGFDLKPEGLMSKKLKLEPTPLRLPKTAVKQQEDVVVESGPVQYAQNEGYGEEEEDGDYFEEEETHLSAAQMLGHTGAEEDYYEDID